MAHRRTSGRRAARRRIDWSLFRLPGLLVLTVLLLLGVKCALNSAESSPRDSDSQAIAAPDWVTPDLLTPNPYSRPGTPLEEVNGVVVHYVGNPGTTAAQNRSFFEGLAQQDGSPGSDTYASSHFLIGLEGEIIQCIPLNEWAYCSSERNRDTISIECCHPDDTGAFTDATYHSLVKLVRWLMDEYHLSTEDVIRHYDVTGKECPRYYVLHPEAWAQFKEDLD